ncbi:MAG TPA: hypothetical protein VN577_07590 [Terriglobales bacterium]|nr:hypothetical protein [Terriglobales bacterium]
MSRPSTCIRRSIGVMAILFCLGLSTVDGLAQTKEKVASAELTEMIVQLRSELTETRQRLAVAEQRIARLENSSAEEQGEADASPHTKESYPSAVDQPHQMTADSDYSDGGTFSLLRSQVAEQQQTKVESTSKYRVKLSGFILMNAYSNRGAADHPDLANRAFRDGPGSVGATLRQSIFGAQVIGPTLAGGRSSANISIDLAGGFPQRPYGTTMGILRLRQASGRIDWETTSLMFGQETPIISPLSPTTFATIAEPGFSWAGNLWVWTPQVIGEKRIRTSDSSYFSISGGLAAPTTEDIPSSSQFVGPNAAELSRRPAFELTAGWHGTRYGQPMVVGLGGFSGRQRYSFGRSADAWAGTAYWDLPLFKFLSWSGEAYRGQATGGLGGAVWQSVAYDGDPDAQSTNMKPLNSIGGWSQVKVKVHPKLEFNVAGGQDNVLAYDLRWAPQLTSEYSSLFARNRVGFVNAVYRPKSNLLLSVEYRKLWTWRYTGAGNSADQVNVGAGVSF